MKKPEEIQNNIKKDLFTVRVKRKTLEKASWQSGWCTICQCSESIWSKPSIVYFSLAPKWSHSWTC